MMRPPKKSGYLLLVIIATLALSVYVGRITATVLLAHGPGYKATPAIERLPAIRPGSGRWL